VGLFSLAAASPEIQAICEDELIRFGVHPNDCTQHFMCMLSRAVVFQCPEGRIYVEELRECVIGDVETCVAEV
jgi:hypothetical protein